MWPVLNGVLGTLPFGVNFCCASASFGATIEPALAAAAPMVTPRCFRRSRRVTCSAIECPPSSCIIILDLCRGPVDGPFGARARPGGSFLALQHGAFRGVKAGVRYQRSRAPPEP